MQKQIFLKIGLSDKDKLCSITSAQKERIVERNKSSEMRVWFVSPFEFWRTTRSYISTTHFWSQAWSPISLACLMGIHITLMDSVTTHLENHCWLMPLAQEKKSSSGENQLSLSSLSSSWRIFYGVSLSNAMNKSNFMKCEIWRTFYPTKGSFLSIIVTYWHVDRSSVIDNPLCVDLSDTL